MSSPLVIYPERSVALPLRYFGNIAYYAAMAAHGHAVICAGTLFDKRQKAVHRCDIADTHGHVSLTVPIVKPHGMRNARWCDVRLSDHGAWWHVHRVTLESAYGRTPFFEYYIDRFLPFLQQDVLMSHPTVASLDLALDKIIRDILAIDTEVEVASDSRHCDTTIPTLPQPGIIPYYQVRAHRQGFIPGLSILDLIFNTGPEAPLVLRNVIQTLQ